MARIHGAALLVQYPDTQAATQVRQTFAGTKTKGEYGVTERKDNTYQWTYNKKPLYTYHEDKKAGEAKGDGVGGVWHIARP